MLVQFASRESMLITRTDVRYSTVDEPGTSFLPCGIQFAFGRTSSHSFHLSNATFFSIVQTDSGLALIIGWRLERCGG